MKTIFIIQGYEEQSQVDQRLTDVCTLEVYAKTEQEALEKAKKYINKKFYRVSQVIEKE